MIDTSFHKTGQTGRGFIEINDQRGTVWAIHSTGSVLWVGGEFGVYGGNIVNHLVRIPDATGATDLTFSSGSDVGFDEPVNALVANDDSLFVGGQFESYRTGSANHIAKLDLLTGEIDTTFSPPANNGFNYDVSAFALVGSSLYVGGEFNAYRGVQYSAFAIAKLDTTSGAIDTTFSPPGRMANGFEDGGVSAIVASPTALYVGGQLHQFRDLGRYSVNNVAKLDLATFALDTTFSPFGETANGTDGEVFSLAWVEDSLFIGGDFMSYRGAAYPNFVKLVASTGAPDTTFVAAGAESGFDSPVRALALREGSLFGAGDFTAYRGVAASASYLAKLSVSTGVLDTTFTPTGATMVGGFRFYAAVPYGPSLLLGGDVSFCDETRCYSGGIRVNRTTRAPE